MNGKQLHENLKLEIGKVFLGNSDAVSRALCCFLSRGHLLIEDVPGIGKTLLAQALGKSFGLSFKRIQMTADLMPSDIVGGTLFNPSNGQFELRQGPIFTTILLLDELNRASSKTQSAVLQAMEERKVSIDGKDYELPEEFFVLATQNPDEEAGVNRLPQSQLDRFALRIAFEALTPEDEKRVLVTVRRNEALSLISSPLSPKEWRTVFQLVDEVKLSDAVIAYVSKIGSFLRNEKKYQLSTRALQSLIRLAQARAFLQARDFVIPEDIQFLATEALAHRLFRRAGGGVLSESNSLQSREKIQSVQEALQIISIH